MPEPTIVAMGGLTDGTLLDYVLGIAPGKRLLYVPTAGMEDPLGPCRGTSACTDAPR